MKMVLKNIIWPEEGEQNEDGCSVAAKSLVAGYLRQFVEKGIHFSEYVLSQCTGLFCIDAIFRELLHVYFKLFEITFKPAYEDSNRTR